VPIDDISQQNRMINEGQNQQKDVERHVDGWIKAHHKTFDGWIAQAIAAAN
jgi:glycine betaine/proline transport system substrate-binding protein